MAFKEKRYVTDQEEERKRLEESEVNERTYVAGERGGYVVRKEEEAKPVEESNVVKEYILENIETPAKVEIALKEKDVHDAKFRAVHTDPADEIKMWLVREWEEHGKRTRAAKEADKHRKSAQKKEHK